MNKEYYLIKTGLALALLFVICILAGLYGILHNQLSYSVSSEYFTKLKFVQFSISPTIPSRVGAAIVGWKASWWMGLVFGVILIPLGLMINGSEANFLAMIKVFLVVLGTTTMITILASISSYLFVNIYNMPAFHFPEGVEEYVQFARAGFIHNSSYLGAIGGLISGIVAIFILKSRGPV